MLIAFKPFTPELLHQPTIQVCCSLGDYTHYFWHRCITSCTRVRASETPLKILAFSLLMSVYEHSLSLASIEYAAHSIPGLNPNGASSITRVPLPPFGHCPHDILYSLRPGDARLHHTLGRKAYGPSLKNLRCPRYSSKIHRKARDVIPT